LRERRAATIPHLPGRGPFGSLARDVREALRSVRRRPGLTAAVVTMLALGIGANTAMFSVADAMLIRFLPYPDADRLVYLTVRSEETGRRRDPTSAELHRWRDELPLFERVEGRRWKSVLITGGAGAARVRMLQVTSGFLDVVGAVPRVGRLLHPVDGLPGAQPVIVLAETLWKTRYGADQAVVGTSLTIDGIPHLIVGVIGDVASDTPGLRFGVFGALPRGGPDAGRTPARGVAWLRAGVPMDAAAQQAASLLADTPGEHAHIETPRNIFESPAFRDSTIALLAATVLLFAVAWVNVAAMLLAAARARSGELALRAALGASRGRLVQALVLESLVLAIAGCAGGLLLAKAGIASFIALGAGPQWTAGLEAARLDARVLAYAAVVSIGTALAVGGLTAFRSSGQSLTAALRESDSPRAGRRRTSGLFIAAQTALSLVLMVVAGLTARAFLEMRLADPGFAADRVLFVRLSLPEDTYATPARRSAFYDELLQGAARLPGVVATGLGYGAMPPSDFTVDGELTIEDGGAAVPDFWVETSFVEPSLFDLLSIPLLAGRPFDAFDIRAADGATDLPVIVSRSLAAHMWPDQQPVGRAFRIAASRGTVRYQVVGVAADVRGRDLEWLHDRTRGWRMYLPLRQNRQFTEVILRVADGLPLPAADLRALVHEIDPDVPVDDGVESGEAHLYSSTRRARFRAVLFGVFSLTSLMLCALGITSVVGHQVSQRTREVGVRMALGARPAQVGRLMLRQGLAPVAAGLAAGLAGALGAARTLRAFLPDISPADPATLSTVIIVLTGVVLLAIRVPVRRATRVDPMTALRAD
jgi:predicted permease